MKPQVARDVTETCRAECERLIEAAGHCSPRGSIHECKCCGKRIPWEELRWVELEGIAGVVPIHDCPRFS